MRTAWARRPARGVAAHRRAAAARLQGAGRGRRHRHLAGRLDPGHRGHAARSSRRTVPPSTSRRAAASTSRCSSARAPPTASSRSSRGWPTGSTRSRRRARRHSIFVAYNGGHVLPGLLPRGHLGHLRPVLDAAGRRRLRGARAGASSTSSSRAPPDRAARLRPAPPRHPGLDVHDGRARPPRPPRCRSAPSPARRRPGRRSPTRSPPGPLRVAGTPHLTGTLTALGAAQPRLLRPGRGHQPGRRHAGAEQRAAGRRAAPVLGRAAPDRAALGGRRRAGRAALYLMVSALSDTFVGMGSRTPGVITLEDTRAHLPLQSP